MKKPPVGIQTFKKLREGDCLYIDKTREAFELIDSGNSYFFLSRPRRLGKSLFLDTLHRIFEGDKALFEELYIADQYDFEPYPVIKIDWRGNFQTSDNLKHVALNILQAN